MSNAQQNTKQSIKQKTEDSGSGGGLSRMMSKIEPFVEDALPDTVGKERFLNICLTTLRRNPKLLNCDRKSLCGAMVQAAQLGLQPNTLGQAYILPYKDEAQLIIGYRGMIDLARRSGDLESINARCVYANDEFDLKFGIEEELTHRPYYLTGAENKGEMIGAYVVARLQGDAHHIEFMPKDEIDSIRNSASGSDRSDSPWQSDYEEMAKKTVVRRAFKYLPVSTDAQRAAEADQSVQTFDEQEGDVVPATVVQESEDSETVEVDGEEATVDTDTGEVQAEQDNSGDAPDPSNWNDNYRAAQEKAKELNINAKQSHDDLKRDIHNTLEAKQQAPQDGELM